MASRDLVNDISVARHFMSRNLTGDGNQAVTGGGRVADLQGSESATTVIIIGNLVDSDNDRSVRFTLQHSDSSASGFEEVPGVFLIGQDSAVWSLPRGDNADFLQREWGYKGIKRYLRLYYEIGAGDIQDTIPACAFTIGGHPLDRPEPLPASRLDEDHRDE